MYLVDGIDPYGANGNTVVSNYSGSVLAKVSNNGTSLPSPGDIVSEAGTTGNPDGHAGVVTAVNVTDGTGTVTIMEQNASSSGWGTIPVSGDALGSLVTGWLHQPAVTPPPPPPPSITASAQGTTVQGDFSGDGKTDVAVFYYYPDARTIIWVFWGNGHGGFSAPTVGWDSGPGAWDATNIRPVVGDFNGDGKDDIAAFYNYGGANTSLFVFMSKGRKFKAPVSVWNSGAGNWDWNSMQAVAGDFRGNGKDQIAVLYAYPDSLTKIFLFADKGSGHFSGPTSAWTSGRGKWNGDSTKLAAGDVNRDGKDDLIAMYDYGGSNTSVFIFFSDGKKFRSPKSEWNSGAGKWSWSQSKLFSGDFNGDRRGDLGVFYGYPDGQTEIWVFMATSKGRLAAPRVAWNSGLNSWDWTRVTPFSGNFNGGRKTDAGAFFAYDGNETGQFLFESRGSTFRNPVSTWISGVGNWTGADTLVS